MKHEVFSSSNMHFRSRLHKAIFPKREHFSVGENIHETIHLVHARFRRTRRVIKKSQLGLSGALDADTGCPALGLGASFNAVHWSERGKQ